VICDKKKKLYENYLVEFNHKGSLELANCFYMAYSIGYADSSEDSYNSDDKLKIILELRNQLAEKDKEIVRLKEDSKNQSENWLRVRDRNMELVSQLELSQKREAILKKEMQSLASCGAKHDLNPTGVIKACGCFDSFLGDNWQYYIKSQDLFVRQFATQALKEVEEVK
jgi:hypothetical protein